MGPRKLIGFIFFASLFSLWLNTLVIADDTFALPLNGLNQQNQLVDQSEEDTKTGATPQNQHEQQVSRKSDEIKTPPVPQRQQDSFIRRNLEEMKAAVPRSLEPKTPDFTPVSEDISPVKIKRVTITARNTPLGDVLHVIAEASGLNLMINRGVRLDQPVTLTLRNVTCENALATIFASLDYSYSINDNMLVVEATSSKIFELGHPALIQSYNLDVGGDILGGAVKDAKTIKGSVSQTSKNDIKAFDFWESLEKSLNDLLKITTETKTTSSSTSDALVNPKTNTDNAEANSNIQNTNVERSTTATTTRKDEEKLGQNIIVNRLTGTIVVTATRRNLQMIENYLDTVKKVLNRQVLVEARIIEVQLTDNLKYGIDWSFLDDIKNFGSLASGFGTAALSLSQSGLSASSDNAAPSFRLGLSRNNFQALLTALQEQGDVKTLSNPRISVMNGQSALLTVGKSTSFISKFSSTTAIAAGSAPITTFNTETSSVLSGMLLGIVPYINAQKEITLTITPIISDLVSLAEKSFGTSGNQVSISIPTVDLREMSTTIKVKGGEMVVIGGLISKKEFNNDQKIPLLGDIPWLGPVLFTRKNKQESRSELVVVLQPFLMPTYE